MKTSKSTQLTEKRGVFYYRLQSDKFELSATRFKYVQMKHDGAKWSQKDNDTTEYFRIIKFELQNKICPETETKIGMRLFFNTIETQKRDFHNSFKSKCHMQF